MREGEEKGGREGWEGRGERGRGGEEEGEGRKGEGRGGKPRSQAVARIADRTAKNCRGSRDLCHAHYQEKLFVRLLTPQLSQCCTPSLNSLAQVVFEIWRSKHIGVTSLTFQGHVTSSFM